MSILSEFGALNPDGTISEAFKAKIIEIYKKNNPDAGEDDLKNLDKYGDWYEQFIDGSIGSSLKTLDLPASTPTIPVFDPSAVASALNLDQPPLDLASIIASFGIPQAALPALLNIKPDDIPDFLNKLPDLVKPPVPAPTPIYPEIKILPTTNEPAFGGNGTPNYPSQEGFNLALINTLVDSQVQFDAVTKNPAYWAAFTPETHFETSKQILEQNLLSTLQPETGNPTGFNAEAAVCVDLLSEAMAVRNAATTVGATKLLSELGKIKGYVTADIKEAPTDGEALKNNLYRLRSNGKNMVVLFPNRNMWYGDQFALDTIYALAEHLYVNTSYRSPGEDPMTLEVGNITGNTFIDPLGNEVPKGLGWRINPWSKTHGGTAFDMAYPMRDGNGNWMSGIEYNEASGGVEEFKTPSPFKCGGGPGEPYKINGKLTHDFPAMYEIGRWLFHEWQIKLIKEGRLLPWTDNGPKTVPYRYILTGKKIFEQFDAWATEKYGKNWNTEHIEMYKAEGWNAFVMFTVEDAHEDHMHINAGRTTVDPDLSYGKQLVYRANPATSEKQFRGTKIKKDFGSGPETVFV